MRFAFIAKHRVAWQTKLMCATLGVSRGGFYEWLRRPQSAHARCNEQLLAQIRISFEQSRRTYGSPRVWRDLHDWGHCCSVHRVARLMRLAGLRGRARRRSLPRDVGERIEAAIAPNLLDRHFEAPQPNTRWVADFTYVPTAEGWLYVAVQVHRYWAKERAT